MRTNVEKIEKHRVMLEIELEPPALDQAIHQAYLKLVKQVNIPGFRKGKAPRHILEKFIGKESIYNEALEQIIPDAYLEAVEQENIEPVDHPKIELVQVEEGQPLIFKATIDVKPEVKLGQYKGIEVTPKEVTVTPEDVQRSLENMQQRYAKLIVVEEGPVEKDDLVVIDYRGTVDGQEFEGNKVENYPLPVGAGVMPGNFEEQLLGVRVDEEREVTITFPEDYPREDLKGKQATFMVTVKSIKRKEVVPLDDDFAKDVSEFETLEELKQDIENRLKITAAERAKQEQRAQVVDKVVSLAEVELPEVMVKHRTDAFLHNLEQRLKQQQVPLEQYLQFRKIELEDLIEEYRPQAEKDVKTDLVLETIAKVEGIAVSDEEIEQEITSIAKGFRQEPEAVRERLAEQGRMEGLVYSILIGKVTDMLAAECQVVEAGEPGEKQPA
jgi:trigger factor